MDVSALLVPQPDWVQIWCKLIVLSVAEAGDCSPLIVIPREDPAGTEGLVILPEDLL